MEIVLVGLSHRTATVQMRERVAFSAEQARRAEGELRERGILEETLVLSTCNRSELYGVPPETAADTAGALTDYLAAFHQLSPADLNGSLYRHNNRTAVRHLFRVAAGLDSMLLGEAEILGQVREAYRAALESGATGPVLNRMFQAALEVGKRVRAETDIGTRPMSVAFAGVKLAERIFGKLREHQALILGAGAMGEQVVEHMRDRGIARIRVANRSRERAVELAGRFSGEVVPWEAVSQALALPDIVVTSISGTEAVFTREILERVMEERGNRALFIIDLGVPRNVPAGVGDLYNVYLYNVDDLTEIVEQNKKARESEIPRAEAIIGEHVAKFESWQASLQAVTFLSELRARVHGEREELLREHLGHLQHLSAADRQKIAQLTEELLDRVLFSRAERIRGMRELRRKLADLEALRDLFGLEKDEP